MFTMQTSGSEFNPEYLHKKKKPDVVVEASDPCAGEGGDSRILGVAGPVT